ncbi:MAG: hypothetical protein ACKVQK_05975 [Burkholderiales bacterium]
MFSRSRLRVYFAADTVSAVSERGWLRREVKCAALPVEHSEAGQAVWVPALAALGALIDNQGFAGSRVDIALSSEFAHLALVPQIQQGLTSLEMQGLAHSLFARVLGDGSAGWTVRYCAADRSALLASATQTPLLAALADVARARHCTLRSVAPLWCCAINRERQRLSRRSIWVVVAESRAVAFGLVERGQWRGIRAKRLDLERGVCASKLIERESRILDTPTRELMYFGDASAGEPYASDWKLEEMSTAEARLGALPAACQPAALAGF